MRLGGKGEKAYGTSNWIHHCGYNCIYLSIINVLNGSIKFDSRLKIAAIDCRQVKGLLSTGEPCWYGDGPGCLPAASNPFMPVLHYRAKETCQLSNTTLLTCQLCDKIPIPFASTHLEYFVSDDEDGSSVRFIFIGLCCWVRTGFLGTVCHGCLGDLSCHSPHTNRCSAQLGKCLHLLAGRPRNNTVQDEKSKKTSQLKLFHLLAGWLYWLRYRWNRSKPDINLW